MTPSAANVPVSHPTRPASPAAGRMAVTFAAAALAAAGCAARASSPAHPAGGIQDVTISATDAFRFAPSTPSVHPGRVRITLIDAGSYPHNLSLPGLHATTASVSGLPGQRSTTMLVDVAAPGRYAFVCTYHSSAGMKGTLVVLSRA